MRAIHNRVFTRGGDHLELFREVAANRAAVGGHSAVPQAEAVKNRAIGFRHVLVAELGGVKVSVEAVGVFHGELAPAHQAKTRAPLVAEFGLNMVEVARQLFVAFDLLARNVGDHFFTGGLDDEVAVMPVFDAQQLRPIGLETPALLPQLGRLHHWHQKLHGTGAVHLFTDDGLDLADHP